MDKLKLLIENTTVKLTDHEGVYIPLTPDDWSRLGQRERNDSVSEYVGGCCGEMSYLQDIINGQFRDGNYFDYPTLFEIGEIAKGHDGFEEFEPWAPEKYIRALESWGQSNFRAWVKIGMTHQALADKLHPARVPLIGDVVKNPGSAEGDLIRKLDEGLTLVWMNDLFGDQSHPATTSGQRHANKLVLRARVYPAVKELTGLLEEQDLSWHGYALVDSTNGKVLDNGFGLCLYDTMAEADRMVEMWKKTESQAREWSEVRRSDNLDQVEIRPASVSTMTGLVLL